MKALIVFLVLFSTQAFSNVMMEASLRTYEDGEFKLTISKKEKSYYATFTGSSETKCEGVLRLVSEDSEAVEAAIMIETCETELGFQNLQEMYSAKLRINPSSATIKIFHQDKFEAMDIPHIELILQ
jgi:hypothetical protein